MGVYPRVCGGTHTARDGPNGYAGLSPRVRGNLRLAGLIAAANRSIPACAGEPTAAASIARCPGVYPRVCGGTAHRRDEALRGSGLSPRVRGNLAPGGMDIDDGGSIPACAGEPDKRASLGNLHWVYPRVCGGTPAAAAVSAAFGGLSPRVRGNPAAGCWRPRSFRSIPACAGEPIRVSARDGLPGVYPRVCGGTCEMPGAAPLSEGLSPRVRGNPLAWLESILPERSIPACAGEPQAAPQQPGQCAVYPRVCGGTCRTCTAGAG